jgi:hypothetical protein
MCLRSILDVETKAPSTNDGVTPKRASRHQMVREPGYVLYTREGASTAAASGRRSLAAVASDVGVATLVQYGAKLTQLRYICANNDK